jgi:UDP-N-acetylmuramyl pentapeptide phosphotransferase/UDP-N-acetylglucosamine-1-phosphate transferase
MELLGFVLFGVAALLSLFLTPLVGKLAVWLGAIDLPGQRKVHQSPIPRLGGLSVVGSMAITLLLAYWFVEAEEHSFFASGNKWVPMLLGGILVFSVGVWDDIRGVSSSIKFAIQAIAAIIAISYGVRFDHITFLESGGIDLGVWAYPLSFLWIIGITNAFNLIDGLDGLSAGLASIAAGTGAAVFLLRGDPTDAILLFIVLGALVGFLRYNFFPARIFLGDSGSLVIGYLLAVTAITGSQKGVTAFAIMFPLLVFGFPIVDTVLSMIRRYVGGLRLLQPYKGTIKQKLQPLECMFEPDQGHIHHRLLAAGLSHRHAVLFLYGLALALSGLALLTVMANGRNAGLVLILVGLASYIGISKLGYDEIRLIRPDSLLNLYERMGLRRRFFLGFLDLVLISLAYWLGLYVKYEANWGPEAFLWYQSMFPIAVGIQFGIFYILGLYNGFWKALSTGDLLRITTATLLGVLSWSILVFISLPPEGVVGFLVIYCLLMLTAMICSRSTYRVLDYFHTGHQKHAGRSAVIYGAGKGGQLALRELSQNTELGLTPLGFIDDDPNFSNCTVSRFPVLGNCEDIESIFSRYPNVVLVIASSKIMQERLEWVFDICKDKQISVYRSIMHFSPVDLESEGDLDIMHNFESKTSITQLSQFTLSTVSPPSKIPIPERKSH